jgi:Flp pilus assembly protein TadG
VRNEDLGDRILRKLAAVVGNVHWFAPRRAPSRLNRAFAKKAAEGRAGWMQATAPGTSLSASGQVLIEMAFVIPLIIFFIVLIVDFGFAMERRKMIQHAVLEGARAGAVGATIAEITDHTNDQAGDIFSNVSVCYENVNGDSTLGNAGDNVRVSGSYTYNFVMGGGALLNIIPAINMTPSAEARLETAVPGANACLTN